MAEMIAAGARRAGHSCNRLEEIGFGNSLSMFGCGTATTDFSTACQELIVQSVDFAGLIGRDIFLMQGSQLTLGWLVIATVANRPWSLVK